MLVAVVPNVGIRRTKHWYFPYQPLVLSVPHRGIRHSPPINHKGLLTLAKRSIGSAVYLIQRYRREKYAEVSGEELDTPHPAGGLSGKRVALELLPDMAK